MAILAVLINAIQTYSQEIQLPRNPETNLIEFSDVIILDSTIIKVELYNRAREWIALSFISANDVIQMDDKDAGIIIAKCNIPISDGGMYLVEGKVEFTVKIQMKDGRCKYWFNNFYHSSYKEGYSGGALENEKPLCGNFNMMKKGWIKVKEMTYSYVKSMIASLRNTLSGIKTDANKDNW